MHEACGYSRVTTKTYDKNTHNFYRDKDCIQKLCKELQDQATKIVNVANKKLKPLTPEEKSEYKKAKHCHICEGKFNTHEESKHYTNNRKVLDHDHYTGKYRGAAHSICNLRYETQREIPVILHNGSSYDFHIIIKEIANEFRTDMRCLGENTEKYVSFSVCLKVTKDDGEVVACKLKFIDSMRFMIHSQENLVNNLSEINMMTFKTCKERCGKISECRNLTYTNNRLIYKWEKCHSKSYKPIGPLTEKFPNTYSICNNDTDKLVLLS